MKLCHTEPINNRFSKRPAPGRAAAAATACRLESKKKDFFLSSVLASKHGSIHACMFSTWLCSTDMLLFAVHLFTVLALR